VLAPGQPERGLQFIDVRDLAEWTIRLVEAGQVGIFNADSPPEFVTMQTLLETCRAASGSEARFVWANDDFLLAHDVGPWLEMPLWIPESDPDSAGFFAISVAKAIAAGLRCRPLETTVADTLAFARARPADRPWRAGMDREKERQLLEALRQA
jgi:2'-hydroxyisoflavone reductase